MRERHLRFSLARYGLTVETHAELLIAQHGKCAICGAAPDPDGIKAASRLHVDHVHGTTAVRGLLCHRCNPGIGYFLDNPELLEAAAAYLRRFE